jgi:hypothetical protein
MTSARLMSRCTVALLIFQRRSLPIRSDYAAQPVDVAVMGIFLMGIFLPLTGCTQEGTRLSFLRILQHAQETRSSEPDNTIFSQCSAGMQRF